MHVCIFIHSPWHKYRTSLQDKIERQQLNIKFDWWLIDAVKADLLWCKSPWRAAPAVWLTAWAFICVTHHPLSLRDHVFMTVSTCPCLLLTQHVLHFIRNHLKPCTLYILCNLIWSSLILTALSPSFPRHCDSYELWPFLNGIIPHVHWRGCVAAKNDLVCVLCDHICMRHHCTNVLQ